MASFRKFDERQCSENTNHLFKCELPGRKKAEAREAPPKAFCAREPGFFRRGSLDRLQSTSLFHPPAPFSCRLGADKRPSAHSHNCRGVTTF